MLFSFPSLKKNKKLLNSSPGSIWIWRNYKIHILWAISTSNTLKAVPDKLRQLGCDTVSMFKSLVWTLKVYISGAASVTSFIEDFSVYDVAQWLTGRIHMEIWRISYTWASNIKLSMAKWRHNQMESAHLEGLSLWFIQSDCKSRAKWKVESAESYWVVSWHHSKFWNVHYISFPDAG